MAAPNVTVEVDLSAHGSERLPRTVKHGIIMRVFLKDIDEMLTTAGLGPRVGDESFVTGLSAVCGSNRIHVAT